MDYDIIDSSSDVPGHPPVRIYQEDNHQDVPSLHPDTSTDHTAHITTPAREGQGMEADFSVQRYQGENQAVGRKRNARRMSTRSPGIRKELKDCVHDKDGRCGTHGEGANKVFEPQWVDGVYRKKWVWRCNVIAMKTEQKLKQTKISFFVGANSGEAEGRGDTIMQLAAAC